MTYEPSLPTRKDLAWAALFYFMNIFDMVATIYSVKHGYAMELNPLMRVLMQDGMGPFLFFKINVVLAITVFLLMYPPSKKVNTILIFASGMYTMVGLCHILIFWNQHAN